MALMRVAVVRPDATVRTSCDLRHCLVPERGPYSATVVGGGLPKAKVLAQSWESQPRVTCGVNRQGRSQCDTPLVRFCGQGCDACLRLSSVTHRCALVVEGGAPQRLIRPQTGGACGDDAGGQMHGIPAVTAVAQTAPWYMQAFRLNLAHFHLS